MFQLPVGYALRERMKAGPGCDTMVWMKPEASNENEGILCELAVIAPNESMQKDMQSETDSELAKDLLSGKANQWQEFHQIEPRAVQAANVKCVQIDFDGVRNGTGKKIVGFQVSGVYKEKVISLIVQAPEPMKADLNPFDNLVKTLQVQ